MGVRAMIVHVENEDILYRRLRRPPVPEAKERDYVLKGDRWVVTYHGFSDKTKRQPSVDVARLCERMGGAKWAQGDTPDAPVVEFCAGDVRDANRTTEGVWIMEKVWEGKKKVDRKKYFPVDVSHSPVEQTPSVRANPAHAHIWVTEEYTSQRVFERLQAALADIASRCEVWPIPPTLEPAPIADVDSNPIDPLEFDNDLDIDRVSLQGGDGTGSPNGPWSGDGSGQGAVEPTEYN